MLARDELAPGHGGGMEWGSDYCHKELPRRGLFLMEFEVFSIPAAGGSGVEELSTCDGRAMCGTWMISRSGGERGRTDAGVRANRRVSRTSLRAQSKGVTLYQQHRPGHGFSGLPDISRIRADSNQSGHRFRF